MDISLDKLVDMMVHKCEYCTFAPGRCSQKDGCRDGITEFLKDKEEVKE